MDKEEKYNGWLVSNSFFKRCFAITGYFLIGYLTIAVVFITILVFIEQMLLLIQ